MGRRSAAALLAAVSLAAALASSASTSPARTSSSYLRVGIFDDGEVLYGVPAQVFPLLRASRAKIIRVNLWWSAAGVHVVTGRPHDPADPADPAYDWTTYDAVVRRAAANKQQVVFSLIGTPPWANQGRGWNVAPTNAKELKFFAMAAAERYSGTYADEDGARLPRVGSWIAWNEPNNPVFLKPQFARDTESATGWRIQSARDYARICNAIVQGVKSVQGTAKVACGVTAPRGNNNPTSGRPSVSPLAFARALKKAGAIGFDAYAHHPYYGSPVETPSTPPPPAANGRPSTAVTLGNLDVLISEVTHLWGQKRIWITEYGYQTNPTDSIVGVPWGKQAQYLKEAVAIARRHPRIDMFIWFLLVDETRPDGWQSGLIGSDLVKKPAFNAFKQAAG